MAVTPTLAGIDLVMRCAAVAGTLRGFVNYASQTGHLSAMVSIAMGCAVVLIAFGMVWHGRRDHQMTLGRLFGQWIELALRAEVLFATSLTLATWCGAEDAQRFGVPFSGVVMVLCAVAVLVARAGCG